MSWGASRLWTHGKPTPVGDAGCAWHLFWDLDIAPPSTYTGTVQPMISIKIEQCPLGEHADCDNADSFVWVANEVDNAGIPLDAEEETRRFIGLLRGYSEHR